MNENLAAVSNILCRINEQIINPLIILLLGIAMLIFLWGGFVFIRGADSDEGRELGKRHMLWGIIGLVIMTSVFGILKIAASSFGIDLPGSCVL